MIFNFVYIAEAGRSVIAAARFYPPPYCRTEKTDSLLRNMGVKTKCTKEEQRQKDRYPVYIRRLAARHPRTHRETKCYFGDTFVLHLNQI